MNEDINYDDLCRVVAEAYYELNAEGWELPPATQLSLPCQQQRRSRALPTDRMIGTQPQLVDGSPRTADRGNLLFNPAELFAGDPFLCAAESALRRIRCLPSLATALAWLKATNPQQTRDLNGWLDHLAFYADEPIPLAEFQQQLDQWVQLHQVVVETYQAALMAPARPTRGGLRSSVDAHRHPAAAAQLRLWPAEDFTRPPAVLREALADGRHEEANEND